MVRCWIVLLLVFWAGLVRAQEFGVINDPDGYVNVRAGKSTSSKIVGTVTNGTIFLINDDDTRPVNWLEISTTYVKNYQEKTPTKSSFTAGSGYVYMDRIMPLSKMSHLSSKNIKISSNRFLGKNDSIILEMTSRPFLAKNHKIPKPGPNTVDVIDNKHAFGVDGNLPRREITNLRLVINNIEVAIPKEAFNDLYEPNFGYLNIYFGKNNTFYVRMLGSDGAGYYDVVWVITNGQLVKRYLDNSYA